MNHKHAAPTELVDLVWPSILYPLGMLVYCAPDGLDAAHLPFVYKADQGAKGKLLAHVARKNLIWRHEADRGRGGQQGRRVV